MSALKEFATLITLNMAELTTIYTQLLIESQPGHNQLSITHQPISARETLQAMVTSCQQQNSIPLVELFEEQSNSPHQFNLYSMIETLGKTLMPIAPNLEASKFLWYSLSDVRDRFRQQVDVNVVTTQTTHQLPTIDTEPLAADASQLFSNGNNHKLRDLQQALVSEVIDEAKNEASSERLLSELSQDDTTRTVLSIIRLAQVQLSMESTLADLPVYSFQVEVDSLVHEVEKILRIHTILPGLIITKNELAVGVISRRKFFEQLGQRYGVAVFMRRPISIMLKKINVDPLLLSAKCPIPEAVDLALNRPPSFVFEPIIVEIAPQTYRLLDVYTLLMAQSKLFANLQTQLQLTNIELEQRVEQRTAELLEANEELTEEIQKRRQVQEALIVARDQAVAASRFKSELLAKISHELRTPLGAIIGHTEMLQVGIYGPTSEKQCQATTKIIDNANYLTELVSQLLDQAQIEAGKLSLKLTSFAPADLIKTSVSSLGGMAQRKGLRLETEIALDVPEQMIGDPVRLQQILVNLVSNAVKYTHQGQVAVRLYRPDARHWAIEVSDTGPGIAPENQARIFEPFGQADVSMTRRHSGIGLGLSIVNQLTTLMGGQVQLNSKIGQGSTFTVTLPLQVI